MFKYQKVARCIVFTRQTCVKMKVEKRSAHLLTVDNCNQSLKQMDYAPRGPVVTRANILERELKSGQKKPFEEVIRTNVGDCHALKQAPSTFIRQVLACCSDPSLLEKSDYPSDVKDRTRLLLSDCGGGSVGAYSDSAGVDIIRKHCAEFFAERDGLPSDSLDFILTNGATEAIKSILALINSTYTDKLPSGVMIPIPQYPLYSATLTEYGMTAINYYLDEENQWQLKISELERSINEARKTCIPKALVVINPGNPTGSVLTRQNIEDIIKFAQRESLMIIADEVYQANVYAEGSQFHSFKKVMAELGISLELASMMSASKGYMGECGLRGGSCEMFGFHPDVKAIVLKLLSARLCSSVLGQIAMDCVVRPPKPGEPSYEVHEREKATVLRSFEERAKLVADTFNSMPGMKSNPVAGSMYAFPQLLLPEKAIQAAKKANQPADFFYVMNLLESTGVCVIPGSGFGQVPGTYHFRTTILPQTDELKRVMEKLKVFHLKFLETYK